MSQPRFKGKFRKEGEVNRRKKASDRLQKINTSQKKNQLPDNDDNHIVEMQQSTTNSDDQHSESFTDPDYGPPTKKKTAMG